MNHTIRIAALITTFGLAGCATTFMGAAHVAGRAACDSKCAQQGMTCTGMVFMGEYSSACVCEVPSPNQSGAAAAAAAGGSAGVVMQMRQQQQQRQAHR